MCAEYAFVQHMIGEVADVDKKFWWDWDADILDTYLAWEPQIKSKSGVDIKPFLNAI